MKKDFNSGIKETHSSTPTIWGELMPSVKQSHEEATRNAKKEIKKQTALLITPSKKKLLEDMAYNRRLSFNAFLNMIIDEYIEQNGGK